MNFPKTDCNHPAQSRIDLKNGDGFHCDECGANIKVVPLGSEPKSAAATGAIIKSEPANLAGSPDPSIIVPGFDETRAAGLLGRMDDAGVVTVAKGATKLTDLALAELRVRFDENGKIKGYETCKTWAALLEKLGIPERTARYRIAKSGVKNPAKKHDGSKSRKPKPLPQVTEPEPQLSASTKPTFAENESGKQREMLTGTEFTSKTQPKNQPQLPQPATKPKRCPECARGIAVVAEDKWKCEGYKDEHIEQGPCGWQNERTPEEYELFEQGRREGRHEGDEKSAQAVREAEALGLSKGEQKAFLDIAERLNARTVWQPKDTPIPEGGVVIREDEYADGKFVEVRIPADTEAPAQVQAAALMLADQIAMKVVKADKALYSDREKRLARLVRPAQNYLGLRGNGSSGTPRAAESEAERINPEAEVADGKRRPIRLTMTLTVEGSQFESAKKKVVEALGENLKTIRKVEHATSRSGQLDEAMQQVEDAKQAVESLKEELEQWKENLPENFQNGSKGEELDEAVQALEEVANRLDEAVSESENVNFPGMF